MANIYSIPDPDIRHPASVDSLTPYSEEHAALGIRRTLIEVFAVGPYKYTSLKDAISQVTREGIMT